MMYWTVLYFLNCSVDVKQWPPTLEVICWFLLMIQVSGLFFFNFFCISLIFN